MRISFVRKGKWSNSFRAFDCCGVLHALVPRRRMKLPHCERSMKRRLIRREAKRCIGVAALAPPYYKQKDWRRKIGVVVSFAFCAVPCRILPGGTSSRLVVSASPASPPNRHWAVAGGRQGLFSPVPSSIPPKERGRRKSFAKMRGERYDRHNAQRVGNHCGEDSQNNQEQPASNGGL